MQSNLPLMSTMQRPPKAAPDVVLRQIESEAQAVAVAMTGFKLAYIAASLGKSETYICRIRKGERPMPRKLIADFCRITGTTLLQDFIDLQAALAEVHHTRTQAQINERLAAQLRAA